MLRPASLAAVVIVWSAFTCIVEGSITCECTTDECQSERKRTCEAGSFCYVQNVRKTITRGCIDGRTPLLCENRRPSKLADGQYEEWPVMFCCRDDFCNSDVEPVRPTEKTKEPEVKPEVSDEDNPYVKDLSEDRTPCPNTNNSDSSRLNPIYIAVPVAGVCVLLALIIFAMYLLRRRNDMYTNYDTYAYHEQIANMNKKQQQIATKTNCDSGTLNRCTDSERSSQGSETKLFLNA